MPVADTHSTKTYTPAPTKRGGFSMFKILAVLGVSLPLASPNPEEITSGGQPIPGVIVQATMGERLLTTVSDENGNFRFSNMLAPAPGVSKRIYSVSIPSSATWSSGPRREDRSHSSITSSHSSGSPRSSGRWTGRSWRGGRPRGRQSARTGIDRGCATRGGASERRG